MLRYQKRMWVQSIIALALSSFALFFTPFPPFVILICYALLQAFITLRTLRPVQYLMQKASQQEVGGLTRTFSHLTEKVLDMGKDFVANASHELRTPITIIRGFAEMLDEFPDLAPAQKKEIVGKIVKTCGRLERLVKSLLTLADLEHFSSRSSKRPCDLNLLAENCKEWLLAVHPEAAIEIKKSDAPLFVIADYDLLEIAVMNLLENAVKYSEKKPQIEIFFEKQRKRAAFCVKDLGVGIPKNDLPHIFDRFYTVDKGRSRKLGGAGLGLAIVKAIMEGHGGEAEVESQLGCGSCFKLCFESHNDAGALASDD